MSDYDQDNGKWYDDYEDEEYDEYYESDYYDLIQENDDLIQENDEYAEALFRSIDGWFYDEKPRTIGDAIGRIY